MKKILSSLAFLCLLGLAACQQHAPKTTGSQEAQAGVYACPMQCEGTKTYPAAGQCPKCGMDLELAEAGSAQPDTNQQQHQH